MVEAEDMKRIEKELSAFQENELQYLKKQIKIRAMRIGEIKNKGETLERINNAERGLFLAYEKLDNFVAGLRNNGYDI
tara:strand:+ start:2067 stop:2300 length:234 start_codon:yes stop_codon:yes gene_type:complete